MFVYNNSIVSHNDIRAATTHHTRSSILKLRASRMDLTSSRPASAHPGTLHFIPPNLSAFEPTKPLVRSLNVNTLLWIGGMEQKSNSPVSKDVR